MFKIYKRIPGGDLRYIISAETLDKAKELAQCYANHAMLGHYDYIIFSADSLVHVHPTAQSCVAYTR